MKEKITAYINSLGTYDYVLFGGVFVTFILLIILALLLRRSILKAVLLILLAFIVLFVGPTFGRKSMYDYLYKNSVTITSQKKLHYSNAIVVKGMIQNDSKKNFQTCKIKITVHKANKNKLKNYLYRFKIIKKMSLYEYEIAKGQKRYFKAIVEPFTYKKDYNISIGADCR